MDVMSRLKKAIDTNPKIFTDAGWIGILIAILVSVEAGAGDKFLSLILFGLIVIPNLILTMWISFLITEKYIIDKDSKK